MLGTETTVSLLKVDNQSVITLSKNSIFHDRSKHINVRFHYLHKCIDEGLINVVYMATEEQLADLLMKALGRVQLLELRHRIGMKATSDHDED
jgi:hypothetical protein